MTSAAADFDVFLSHARPDADRVEEVAGHLRTRHGVEPWLDRWMLIPGESWQDALALALERAASCAVFIGKETPGGWFKSEIHKALSRRARDGAFRVIPVILPGVDARDGRALRDSFLDLQTWVEFKTGCDDERALRLLVCGVRGIAPGPATAPPRDGASHDLVARLRTLMELHEQGLITDAVHHEYQIRLLEELL